MLVTVLEAVTVNGQSFELGSVRWAGGVMAPQGANYLEEVRFEGTLPIWRYVTPLFSLEKRVIMDHGANVTRLQYTLLRAVAPVTMTLRPVVDCRDYHGRSSASDWMPTVTAHVDRISVDWGSADHRLHMQMPGAGVEGQVSWYRGFDLAQERLRGLTDREDHVQAGLFKAELMLGETVEFAASVGALPLAPETMADSLGAETARQEMLLAAWQAVRPAGPSTPWIERLVLAADQFIVRRKLNDGSSGHTVIAGYHWFADWGRDTMISLPGLAIETGRTDIAASILRGFAETVDRGMIPNRFPDAGTAPEYNTVDATFWFIEAVAAHHDATGDLSVLTDLFGVLEDIVSHMQHGTRYGIRVDPADGLITAGEPGVQLTWMDAKVGDWVVTPRIGKPVEVNALWVSGLRFMVRAAGVLGRDPAPYKLLLAKASTGFARFWNPDVGYCYDVLDGPQGHEVALRPNQIFAARAATGIFDADRCRQIVRRCEEALLTPVGLRSLAQSDPAYRPHYGGDQVSRDGAYHQGTVWAWLIGPFIEAHLDSYNDPVRAREVLAPMADQLGIEGIGTINEIFEADAPHAPRGCVAQAWSVAECIRAWHLIARASDRTCEMNRSVQ